MFANRGPLKKKYYSSSGIKRTAVRGNVEHTLPNKGRRILHNWIQSRSEDNQQKCSLGFDHKPDYLSFGASQRHLAGHGSKQNTGLDKLAQQGSFHVLYE